MLTDQQFERSRALALRLGGIELFGRHRELLGRRARRIGIRDEAGWDALLGATEGGEAEPQRRFIALLTIKHTRFFREPHQIDLAAEHALQAATRGAGPTRLLCLGCATGQEPYSLAMTLLDALRDRADRASVLATDLDQQALTIARAGSYEAAELQSLPADARRRHMRDQGGGRAQVSDAVRSLVSFAPLNLVDERWDVEGPFDVVLCRNVLMYLAADHRYAALERIASLLGPGGLLLIDPSEHLGAAAHLFGTGARGVFASRHALRRRP